MCAAGRERPTAQGDRSGTNRSPKRSAFACASFADENPGSIFVAGHLWMRGKVCTLATLFLSMWVGACALPADIHRVDIAGDERLGERQLGAQALEQTFTREGAHRVSPWLAGEGDATRVGWLLEMNAGATERVVTLEARGYDENGLYSSWLPAHYTFSEGALRVARADFERPMQAVQIRMLAGDIEHIQALTYAAVQPIDEARIDDSDPAASVDFQLHLPATQNWALLDDVRPRSDWEARDTLCNQSDPVKTRISIHHTVSAADDEPGYPARLRALQAYHMDVRGFCDLGYHMVVTIDGTVWEGRDASLQGAHVYGNNPQNLGISLMGCFDSSEDCRPFPPQEPPTELIDGLVDVVARASAFYELGITVNTVLGHRDNPDQSTACPGDQVWQRLDEIRSAAIERRDAQIVDAGPVDAGIVDAGPITPDNTGRVQGTIWDLAITSNPSEAGAMRAYIDTAEITCSCGETASARINDSYWVMDVPPGRHTFTAAAPGYAPSSREIVVATDDLIWASIGLSPEELAVRLTVVVSDFESGDPIQDMRVAVTGATAAFTNVAGGVSFDLTEGEVLVEVTKSGYESMQRTLELRAGQDQAIGVRMKRLGSGGGGGNNAWWPGGDGGGDGGGGTCSCHASQVPHTGLPGWGLLASLVLPVLVRRRRGR